MRGLTLLIACSLLFACNEKPAKAPTPPAGEGSTVEAPTEAKETPKVEEAKAPAKPQASDDVEEAELVTNPAEGTPEAVIRSLLQAAMNPDEAAGWETTKALLHSGMQTKRALKSYREMNYPASRRKVALFTPDDTKPDFRIARTTKPADDRIKIFVHNEKSMPTPCILRKDAEAGGAWRVHVCSL